MEENDIEGHSLPQNQGAGKHHPDILGPISVAPVSVGYDETLTFVVSSSLTPTAKNFVTQLLHLVNG